MGDFKVVENGGLKKKDLEQGYSNEKPEDDDECCYGPLMDSEDTQGGFLERNNFYDRI